jgi:Helix-turn-helix domain
LSLKQIVERELLDERTAADYLGISLSTLRRYRYGIGGRHGLPVIKIGHAVRYARADLNRFVASRRQFPKARDEH